MTKYRNGLVTISSIRGAAPTTPQGCALTEGDVIGEVLGERDWYVLGERDWYVLGERDWYVLGERD
jgi:hypothetical protein